MAMLSVKIRKETGRKTEILRKKGIIPAVLYGPGVKDVLVEVNEKDFEKVFKQTGESSLVDLEIDGEKESRKVFIHDIQRNPVTDKFMHADFFQASLKDEIEVKVPLIFEGISLAVKDLGANLVKNITEIEVKALPHNLPHDIKVKIDGLLKIGDHILVKDLVVPKDVKIMKKPEEIVVSAVEPEKVEEELEKPIEEKVEDVGKVEKEKKEEEVTEEAGGEKK